MALLLRRNHNTLVRTARYMGFSRRGFHDNTDNNDLLSQNLQNEVKALKEHVVDMNVKLTELASVIESRRTRNATGFYRNYVLGKLIVCRVGDTIRYNGMLAQVLRKGPLFVDIKLEKGGLQAILNSKFVDTANPPIIVEKGDAWKK